MTESTELAVHHQSTELSVDMVLDRLQSIQELMKRAMIDGVDYGQIPGTNSKPTLLKAGAEKLCVMFRFAPKYKTEKHFHNDGHLTVESTCQIYDMAGTFLGEASTICSTRESKYAYRKSERTCPKCGKPAIIKGKAEYGGGWLCWANKGGCKAKFIDNDPSIIGQATGRIPNEDLPDVYNTVLRIAEKRAYIGAVRLVTGCSSLFDEEIPGHTENEVKPDHEPIPQENLIDQEELKKWSDDLEASQSVASFISLFDATPPQYQTILGLQMFRRVIKACETLEELKAVWEKCGQYKLKTALEADKNTQKKEIEAKEAVPAGEPSPF